MLDTLWKGLPYLISGMVQTVHLSAITIVFGTLVGAALGIVSLNRFFVTRLVITIYSFVIRGVPILIVMFVAVFGFPLLGLYVSDFLSVSVALVLYAAAFVCEITRSGILSVPKTQIEAAKAIGFRPFQILFRIVFPQAARVSLGPFIAHCVMCVKFTAYVSVVGVWELSYAARELTERTLAPFQIFLGAMLLYFAICYPLSIFAQVLARRPTFGGARI